MAWAFVGDNLEEIAIEISLWTVAAEVVLEESVAERILIEKQFEERPGFDFRRWKK
jgi:hypothetical protein